MVTPTALALLGLLGGCDDSCERVLHEFEGLRATVNSEGAADEGRWRDNKRALRNGLSACPSSHTSFEISLGLIDGAGTAYVTRLDLAAAADDATTALMLARRSTERTGISGGRTEHMGGMSALHFAAYFESPKSARALLDSGVEVNATDSNGNSPLFLAGANTRDGLATIHLLIRRGADPTLRNKYGFSAIQGVVIGKRFRKGYCLVAAVATLPVRSDALVSGITELEHNLRRLAATSPAEAEAAQLAAERYCRSGAP
jgi:hypothetical protein